MSKTCIFHLYLQKAMPMRHKRLDFVSLPQWLTYVLDFAKSLMSEKLRSRIRVCDDFIKLKFTQNIINQSMHIIFYIFF